MDVLSGNLKNCDFEGPDGLERNEYNELDLEDDGINAMISGPREPGSNHEILLSGSCFAYQTKRPVSREHC